MANIINCPNMNSWKSLFFCFFLFFILICLVFHFFSLLLSFALIVCLDFVYSIFVYFLFSIGVFPLSLLFAVRPTASRGSATHVFLVTTVYSFVPHNWCSTLQINSKIACNQTFRLGSSVGRDLPPPLSNI